MNNKIQIYSATIINIDPFDIETKLHNMEAELVESSVKSIQRFDIQKGYHFIQPIYTSTKFQPIFEQLSHLTVGGNSLIKQSIFLNIKRDGDNSEIMLSSKNIHLKIHMTVDQTQSMIKVLRAGGMIKKGLVKKTTAVFTFEPLKCIYTIYSFSHMPSFLEVRAVEETSVLDGLAALGIAINRAILNTPFSKIIGRYHLKPSLDLLRFLI